MPVLVDYLCKRTGIDSDLGTTRAQAPVTDALMELCIALNELKGESVTVSPKALLNALTFLRGGRQLLGYDQQDAHELLGFVTASLTKEEIPRFPRVIPLFEPLEPIEIDGQFIFAGKKTGSPLSRHLRVPTTGLLASRLCCMQCGYKTPIGHDTFDNLSLAVPRTSHASLRDLLEAHVSSEVISDYTCDRCSLKATLDAIHVQIKLTNKSIKQLKETRQEKLEALQNIVNQEAGSAQKATVPKPVPRKRIKTAKDDQSSPDGEVMFFISYLIRKGHFQAFNRNRIQTACIRGKTAGKEIAFPFGNPGGSRKGRNHCQS